MPYGKKSPAKMGHKDSAMKMGHKDSAMKMESAKQEKYNLLHDNPVAKHASWMSKHSKSAFQMGHESPAKMHGGDHVDHAAKVKEHDRKQGLLDLKTGER